MVQDNNKSGESVALPVRTEEDDVSLDERLTENAKSVFRARYESKDLQGESVETPKDVMERVGNNVALAEAVFSTSGPDVDFTIDQGSLKDSLNNPSEVIPDDSGPLPLTESIAPYVDFDKVLPQLPQDVRRKVERKASEFHEQLKKTQLIPNTPALANMGDELQMGSACFVTSPKDDMKDIGNTATDASLIFQSGGGVGYAFWKLRPYGDRVGSSGGISSGPVTFMETYDQVCQTVEQGGLRRGAQMAIMRISHPDIIEFIHSKNKDVSLARTLKLNDPDDYTYTSFNEALEEARELIDEQGRVPKHLRNAVEGYLSNFNISVGLTDEFMEAVKNDDDYTFINPRTGEPHVASEYTVEMYERYGLGRFVEEGEVLTVPANVLWKRIINGSHQNGEPGYFFIDETNRQHAFDVESTPTGDSSPYEILATNPCLTGDSLAMTNDGYKKIEDISAGEKIITGYAYETVDEIEIHDDVPVYDVEFSDGGSLTATPAHQFRAIPKGRGGKKTEAIRLDQLNEGDFVKVQPSYHGNINGEEEYSQYRKGLKTGILLGDGCYTKKQLERDVITITSNANDEDYVDNLLSIFDIEGGPSIDGNTATIRIPNGNEIADELNLSPAKAPDKTFDPEDIDSRHMARGLLDGLILSDGDINMNESSPKVRYSTTSKDLAQTVRLAFLAIGSHARISTSSKNKSSGKIDGRQIERNHPVHTVYVSGESLRNYTTSSVIGAYNDDYDEKMIKLRSEYMLTGNTWKTQIESIEPAGTDTVYDLYCSESDTWTTNGYVSRGCGEQPLMENDSCNLMHVNLASILNEDRPTWQEYNDRMENYDTEHTLEDKVNDYLIEAVDWQDLDERVRTGINFLDNMITMSDFATDEISETIRNNRKVGLGIMGLAHMLIEMGVPYASEEGNEVSKQVMKHINGMSKEASHDLALERGSFANWEDSKYANPQEHAEWIESQLGHVPSQPFEMRNYNTTTIAPTGSTSMVGNTSGGCEPIYQVCYYKNVSDDIQGDEMLVEFDDLFLRTLEKNNIDIDEVKQEAVELMEQNQFDGVDSLSIPQTIKDVFVTAQDLSGLEHASVQCALQEGIDSAISKTCNFPEDATREDVAETAMYVYENGGKGFTMYRDGSRTKQVNTTRKDNQESSDSDDDMVGTKGNDAMDCQNPQCGSSNTYEQEGCTYCKDCEWSKCSW